VHTVDRPFECKKSVEGRSLIVNSL
jgi:hypothetical protein